MKDSLVSYYTENGLKKDYQIGNYFDCGGCGDIYRLDDNTCLKLFSDEFFFDSKALKKIKKLKLDNFYRIYDLLYNKEKHFCGYTMKYYDKENIDITKMPIDYTLDNLYRLYPSFKELTNKRINAFDCNPDNVILGKKDITIIDADVFYIDDESPLKELWEDNYWTLMKLFRELYYDALKPLGYSSYDYEYILTELFNEKKGIEAVEKKLIKHKYPIDYVRKELGEI